MLSKIITALFAGVPSERPDHRNTSDESFHHGL
jgi:hypothetical protein